MYADFAELFKGLFGVYFPGLSLLKTFGFLVAMAFFMAGFTLYLELKRKEDDGIISGEIKEVTLGGKINWLSYITNAIFGFLVAYKIVGMLQHVKTAAPDPVKFIASTEGNLLAGIVGAIIFTLLKFADKERYGIKIPSVPTNFKIKIPHHQRVGDIAVVAAVAGFAGAKLFNAFESWEYFLSNPIDSLVSSSGFTFYGGLILATISLYLYTKKWGLNFKILCDAAAPGLILAYGFGRLGCQVSGDGDWGIFNSAYVTNIEGKAVPTTDTSSFTQAQQQYPQFFKSEFKDYKQVPAKHIARPAALSFLPHSFFAYSYSNNVNNVGIPLQGCSGNYCTTLPAPVFPTPLYEFAMCVLIFGILWGLRKKLKEPLQLFGVYLILNGIERYAIEQIRVNYKYQLGFWNPTQAELIALSLMLAGVVILVIKSRKKINEAPINNA
jgi:phosphatidylglycerol---prolipoprotein diacylglyceryl transferase